MTLTKLRSILPRANPAGISARSPRLCVSASPCLFLLLTLSVAPNTPAQTNFTSGSTGLDGPLNVTASTNLDMPPNGIFNFTTITVASGVTLRFNRNPLNTPVYLLATGDVSINGTIDVSGGNSQQQVPGAGGPGGFDGGFGGFGVADFGGTGLGSDGLGPGGGRRGSRGGAGAYATQGSGAGAATYGNSLIVPLIGGSGGGGNDGTSGLAGAGGGGAILVASPTRIAVDGYVRSFGGAANNCDYGNGSGGAIRLVAPIVTGIGYLDVSGISSGCNYVGGSGRSRVDCLDWYLVRTVHAIGPTSRGTQMFVFPPLQPRLDIIQAAGQSIPLGSPNGITVVLATGATNAQTVVVRATNFTNDVPITVAVIPNDHSSATFQALISITNNPATVTIPVTLSAGSTNRLMVWTTPL